MTALTFSDFRKNMASSFDLVDAGEHVRVTLQHMTELFTIFMTKRWSC